MKLYSSTCLQKGPFYTQLGEAKRHCEKNKQCVGMANSLCRYENGFDICLYAIYSNSAMKKDKRSDCVYKKAERYSKCTL